MMIEVQTFCVHEGDEVFIHYCTFYYQLKENNIKKNILRPFISHGLCMQVFHLYRLCQCFHMMLCILILLLLLITHWIVIP